MTPEQIEATRPAFEAFMRSRSVDVTTQTGAWGTPQYVHSHVEASWFAWQAAKADAVPVAIRYRMAGDMQWQYTERADQATHATEVEQLSVMLQGAKNED